MASSPGTSASSAMTPAQRMAQQHAEHFHTPTVEDVPDEETTSIPAQTTKPLDPEPTTSQDPVILNGSNGYVMSAKAAGKQKAQDPDTSALGASTSNAASLDTKSEEAFPSLGPAKVTPIASGWGARPAFAGAARANGVVNGTSRPPNPPAVSRAPAQAMPPRSAVQLPGRYEEEYPMPTKSVSSNLRRPIPDILKEITKSSPVRIETTTGIRNGEPSLIFKAQGPAQNIVREKLRKVAAEIGKSEKVPIAIPAPLRSQVIGKGGAKIKQIQELSGARIQLPPVSAHTGSSEADDDDMLEATLEGDPIAVGLARREIEKIIGQRVLDANLAVKGIPPELFPFLTSPHYAPHRARHEQSGVSVRIPSYQTWSNQPPASHPTEFVPQDRYNIHVAGPSESARQARAEIEQRAKELQEQLAVEELLGIERDRHQFILGPTGLSLDDFLRETGCAIVLPPDHDDTETIHIVGPPERLEQARDRAMDLASGMVNNTIDVSRQYQGPRDAQAAYMRDLSRYMQGRRSLDRIANQHNAQISFPSDPAQPWTLWSRDTRTGMKARSEILNAISGHPAARFRNVHVHPFYQQELERQYAQSLRDEHGVHLVKPDGDSPILLVYEDSGAAKDYVLPQRRPAADELAQFEEALQKAEQYLLGAIGGQEEITDRGIDAPLKYREKVARFASKQDPEIRYPVQYQGLSGPSVKNGNYTVTLQGPTRMVDENAERLLAFIEEQIRDEAERDYTTSCSFPKAFRGRLIGSGGETINKIRDDFDVEVNFNSEADRVDIKGPPAKAEAAKAHIISIAKKAEDEATHELIIEPRFHGQLIGSQGAQRKRYEDRYGVQIFFPDINPSPADEAVNGASKRRRPPQAPNVVVIRGPRKGADAAKDDLLQMYLDTKSSSFTSTVSAAPDQLASLVGKGGAEVRALREQTGAEIDVPDGRNAPLDEAGRAQVMIKGTKEAVQKAKKVLEERIKVYDANVNETITVNRKHYPSLVGRGSENLQKLVAAAGGDPSEHTRIIQVPHSSTQSEEIKIAGSEEVVRNLVAAINEFVLAQENRVTETIEVPPERHGALIGARGAVKKGLESDCNVQMVIPSTAITGPERAQIKIHGQPADVEKAKERIASILRQGTRGPGETVLIPTRLHHTIADEGRFFNSLRRDLRVNVNHNGQKVPTEQMPAAAQPELTSLPLITDDESTSAGPSAGDIANSINWNIVSNEPPQSGDDATIPWVLKGDSDSVAQAKLRVEEAISRAQQSVTGYLVLPDPSNTHALVIGPGGSTIKKIREACGCNPRVPQGAGPIRITGSRADVEETKERIIQAVVDGADRRSRGPRSPR